MWPEQASGSGLLEIFSQLVLNFIEESRNFNFDFLHKKQPKVVKTIISLKVLI
jgi:hypothetical protein